MASKSFKDYAVYNNNPSLEGRVSGVAIANVRIDDEVVKMVDTVSGEMINQYRILGSGERVLIDKSPFVKVYQEGFDDLGELSNAGLKMLIYIWKKLRKDCDYFQVNMAEAKAMSGYNSINAVYNGLYDLLERGFIYRKVGESEYYVNVEKFFNGRRTKLARLQELQSKLDGVGG